MAAGEEGEDLKVTCDRNERTRRTGVLVPGTTGSLRDCLDDSIFKWEKRSGEQVLGWVCAMEAPVGPSEGGEAAAVEAKAAQAAGVTPGTGRAAACWRGEAACACAALWLRFRP